MSDIGFGPYVLAIGYTPSFNDGDPCTYSLDYFLTGDRPLTDDELEQIKDSYDDFLWKAEIEGWKEHDLDRWDRVMVEYHCPEGLYYAGPEGVICHEEIYDY